MYLMAKILKKPEKQALALYGRLRQENLDQLDSVQILEELNVPPGNMLEMLKGKRAGEHSIRINDQYRICFIWSETGPDSVEITDYH